jgi:hypothetical protein
VFRYAQTWLWHMVAGFLFSDGSENTISWLVLPLLRLEWDIIGTYSWGSAALAWLYCALCDGFLRIGPNANLGGCTYLLQIWMWERFPVARLYHHAPQVCGYLLIFIIHIFCWLCLANNMEYNFQPSSFEDAESQPLLGYRWTRITNVTGTIKCRYMTYSNAFDCITSTQVWQHLSTCPLYLHVAYLLVLTSVKNLHVTW